MEVTKRLHVAGLTPSITLKDIENRFGRFGTVLSVEDCGRDGNGDPRKYCFINLHASQPQLNKLMQTFSNSHWKDAKLRISEAKPNYIGRLQMDKEKAAEKERKKEVRRLTRLLQKKLRGNLKTYAKDMRLTSPYNAKWRTGWYITPAKHLIHPVHIRPDHPVPIPSTSRAPAAAPAKAKTDKPPKAPKRSKQIMIDPRRYGAMHYGENMISSEGVTPDNRPWKCQEDENGHVTWYKDNEVSEDKETYDISHADPRKVFEQNADQYNYLDDKAVVSKPPPTANKVEEIESQVRRLEEEEKQYGEDALSDDDEDEIFAMLESQRLRENRSESPLFEGAQSKSFDWLNSVPDTDQKQRKAQLPPPPSVDPSAEEIKKEHKSQNALLDSLFKNDSFGRRASIDMDSD